MERQNSDHLTDQEIALLISGEGSAALSQTLSGHLADCEECRILLVECIREMHRTETTGDLTELLENDKEIIKSILIKMQEKHPELLASEKSFRSILLFPLATKQCEEQFALAAKPIDDLVGDLPTLTSDDGSIVVHFRKPYPEQPYRAYIVRKTPAERGKMWLVFADSGDSYLADKSGEVDLPGISKEALARGKIKIELRPLES